jgi:hypothetical protein
MDAPVSNPICPACQCENKAGMKFCKQCGAALIGGSAAALAPAPAMTSLEYAQSVFARVPTLQVLDIVDAGSDLVVFTAKHRSGRFGMPLTFSGRLQVHRPNDGPATVTPELRMTPGSMGLCAGLAILGFIVLGSLPREWISDDMFLGAIVLGAGAAVWLVASKLPGRVGQLLRDAVGDEGAHA